MRWTAYCVLGFALMVALASMFLLNSYQCPLVHIVVKNTALQKAPRDDKPRIEAAFERARRAADQQNRINAYLEALFAISQRMEKVQGLSHQGSEEIIRALDAFSGQRQEVGTF
ncbi:MAG: hypothetical protein HY644_05745 [Acidobacteria bacterium]|nr:hypothetical protein [Acidobacteriota bacterium]